MEDSEVDVESLTYDTLTAEFSAHSGGRPVTYPLTPFYDPDRDSLFVTSAPAFAAKVEKARDNPEVSLLFGYDDEPLLVRGEAEVHDDDLRHNAKYVRRLVRSEPRGHKRDLFVKTERRLANPVGSLFLDWYGLRILVEIQPTEVERFDRAGTSAFEPWPEADLSAGEAGKHERAVFTAVDDRGPRSLPVTEFDVTDGRAKLELAAETDVDEGQPCCLLLHWHDDDLENLGQRLVRGRAHEVDGDVVHLEAGSTTEMSNEGLLDLARFVWEGKRRTRDYFDETGVTGWTW